MAAHGFMFANKIPNHDDLIHYASIQGAGAESGRFVLAFFWKLFSTLSTPWFNGILGLCFLGAACYFLCDAFDLRTLWQPLALGSLLVTHPAITSMYCYMYQAHLFMLGIWFATLAVWCAAKGNRWWLGVPVCCFLATGVYQANLLLTIALLIALVMQRTLCASDGTQTARQSWGFAVGCAAGAIIGLVLYFAATWAMTHMRGLVLNEYQGINSMGRLEISNIPQKIVTAYRSAWEELIARPPAYSTKIMRLLELGLLACGALAVGLGAVRLSRRRRFAQGVLLLVCAVLLPLVGEGIYLMGEGIADHQLTRYPLMILLLVAILLLPTAVHGLTLPRVPLRRVCAAVLTALYLLYGFVFCMFSNQAYYRLHLGFTRAEHMAGRIAAHIEELDGYHPGIRAVGVGSMGEGEHLIYYEPEITERFIPMVGVRNETDYFWPHLYLRLIRQVVGLPITPVYDGELEWTPQLQAFVDAMPCYPAKGSIAIYEDEDGDMVVIKLA